MMIESFSPEDTFKAGEQLAKEARPGDIYTLNGDLGVGKTIFTKGMDRGLGIEEPVTSPTFTILQEYESGRLPLYHFDVYRIGDPEEMDEIGYEDYFYGQGICLIEWAGLIEELIPAEAIRVSIEKNLQKGLTSDQIRQIFVGDITNWAELG